MFPFQQWKEIGAAFSQLASRGDGCRAVILVGAGKHAFSAGIDVADPTFFAGAGSNNNNNNIDTARRGLAFLPLIQEMQSCFTAVESCPVPVIAALHGACIGAGMDLACCADIRLSSFDCIYSVREVRLGLAADVGTLQRFPKSCCGGFGSRVKELCLTGEDFDAHEALRIGFVSRLSGRVWEEAVEVACRVAALSPVAVVGTKTSLNYSRDHSVSDGLHHVATHNALALMSADLGLTGGGDTRPDTFENMAPHARL